MIGRIYFAILLVAVGAIVTANPVVLLDQEVFLLE